MAAPSGIVWGSIVTGSKSTRKGRIGIYAGVTTTNTSVTVNVQVWFWSMYSVDDSNNSYYYNESSTATTLIGSVDINHTVATGEGWSTSNQTKLGESTYTYTRGTAESTKYYAAKFTGVDTLYASSVMTASISVTVPALTSYTVEYNANGGSGAPSTQTKWYGKSLTLSSTKPTRTGYSFQGWSTSTDSSVEYAAGASYTANAGVTLYAVWKANTYTVKFNANGGSGAPANQTKTYGKTLTLSSTIPTRANYNFLGWGTSSSATTATYSAGGSYTKNAGATLYAVWELAYVKPKIYNISVYRAEPETGDPIDDGQAVQVAFDWETTYNDVAVLIEWVSPSGDSGSHSYEPNTGTSGSDSTFIEPGDQDGDFTFDHETSYAFTITVTDGGGSTSVNISLLSATALIDGIPENKGVAFGKFAELEGVADFAYEGYFREPVYGKALGMDKLPAIPENSDLNNYIDPGCYAVQSNAIAATVANIPVARAGRLEVWSSTGEGVRSEQWSYLRQRYIPYNSANAVWERDVSRGEDNVWNYYDWFKSSLTQAAANKVYHEPTVLWSGAYYMNASQTANLSEAVSAQPNGIVLVFSAYVDGAASNAEWTHHFVPKYHVSAHHGAGCSFFMHTVKFGTIAAKYLYINDTSIAGHADNNATGTANGITFNNARYVLRYVIGV